MIVRHVYEDRLAGVGADGVQDIRFARSSDYRPPDLTATRRSVTNREAVRRYSTLGFQEAANLDDGDLWPVSYALTSWGSEVEKMVTGMP